MQKKKLILSAIITFALAVSAVAQIQTKTFRGFVSGERVEMTLTRSGDQLSGSYFYARFGKSLTLDGTIDANGSFKLTETDSTGKKTGEFTGEWTEKSYENGASLEGNWFKPNSKSDGSGFFASEQMIDFTGAGKITSRKFVEKNKLKRFDITVEYPEVSGIDAAAAARFNILAKQRAMAMVAEFRKDMLAQTAEDLKFLPQGSNNYLDVGYNIEWATDNLLSISFLNGVFTGGIHPNTETRTLNFDLKTGKEINLADLFQPKSNYLKAISDFSIADLKARISDMSDEEWLKTGAGAKSENFSEWNLTKKGLLFNFDAYQVAAYAAGPQTVIIPYEKLKSIFRKDGFAAKIAN